MARLQQLFGEDSACADDLLAIVENQEHPLVAEKRDERFQHRLARLFSQAQRGRDHGRDQRGIQHCSHVHKPDAICELVHGFGRRLQRKARLSIPARPRKRQQPSAGHQVLDLCEFLFAADETGQLLGQVVSERAQ